MGTNFFMGMRQKGLDLYEVASFSTAPLEAPLTAVEMKFNRSGAPTPIVVEPNSRVRAEITRALGMLLPCVVYMLQGLGLSYPRSSLKIPLRVLFISDSGSLLFSLMIHVLKFIPIFQSPVE